MRALGRQLFSFVWLDTSQQVEQLFLHFILDLMRRIRAAIRADELTQLREEFSSRYRVAYAAAGVTPQSAGGQ